MGKAAGIGRGGRAVAVCLSVIWVAAGLGAIAIGLWFRPGPLPIVLGLLAIGYGWIWSRVAITGERQQWPPRPGSKP